MGGYQNSLFYRLCPKSGQSKDVCFCEQCLYEESINPPAWAIEPQEIETENDVLTVQYVRTQLTYITETVKKANRVPMARRTGSKQTGQDRPKNGIDRLELKDLSIDKKRCRVLWAGDPSEIGVNFDWATLSIKFESVASGVRRVYTMGDNNPLVDCFDAGFGRDESAWIGREFFAWKVKEGILEKEFIRFSCIAPDGTEIPFDYTKEVSTHASQSL